MHKHPTLTEERLRRTTRFIAELVYAPSISLEIAAWRVGGEPVPYAEAVRQPYEPFAVGEMWGVPWDTVWFRFTANIPPEWAGKEVAALIRLGGLSGEGFTCEGQVWQNGEPVRAINVNRANVPLAPSATGGETFSFYLEAAANPCGGGGSYNFAELASDAPLFRLLQADAACLNREVYDYQQDFQLALEVMRTLPEGSARRGSLLAALNESANRLSPGDARTVPSAREALRGVLQKRNGDSVHQISAVGHAHIDTAWLWPLRETIRKCARTFSTALACMAEYPDYVFACSQPQQYLWMKEYFPTIYAGIKAAIARGQWEPIGSMWVEPDCNIPNGESLVRQILHGRNFFLDEFGYQTTQLWLPDVFGYSAALPQLLVKAGIRHFVTQKISWNQFNRFPHHTFLWEGLDGTRIFSHFLPADTYNADFSPQQLAFTAANFRDHDRANRSLYAYGWGDGGGGPTQEMLEAAERLHDFEGMPRVTQEKVSDFLTKAEEDARDLPLWVGELYLELHRGTYTTQAKTKRLHRSCEALLRDAELFSVLAPAAGVVRKELPRAVYDVARKEEHDVAAYLDRAWKLLLLNQFHDIIPGSSIQWVYEDSARDFASIAELADAVLAPARKEIVATIDCSCAVDPLIVFNTTSFSRREVVSLPDGSPICVEAPACGYAVNDCATSPGMPPVTVLRGERLIIDNALLRVTFDSRGLLTSIYDHLARREILLPGEPANIFQLHRDYPNFHEAWDIDLFSLETVEEILDLQTLEVVEDHPLRATVLVVRRFGKSLLRQRISLCAGSPRIDFATEVDWQEKQRLLRVAFPVNIRSLQATYETQFGHVQRPTHYNTSWDLARFEVCAQKWADLSEPGYGVALLNDCKYGYGIHGHTLSLSLLRAPLEPDPSADRGSHRFTYSLLPHLDDFRRGEVVAQAWALNHPLQLLPAEKRTGSSPSRQSYFSVDHPAVLLEAVKQAEKEDAIIVRLSESFGSRFEATLRTTLLVREAYSADLMENTIAPVEISDGRIRFQMQPFEVLTFKLIRQPG